MIKIIGYLIFAFFYYLSSIFPVKKNKVLCIMTHDSSDDSNVGVIVSYLKNIEDNYTFQYIKKSEVKDVKGNHLFKSFLSFFIKKPYHMATSEFILQDNIFLPMAFIRFRKKVKVVQLWHGTGTIKKFGQSTNQGQLRWLESMANKTITHLIINSSATKTIYQEAFGIEEEKIFELGLPRTDTLFDENKIQKDLEEFYSEYSEMKNKKLILYAPTFRDDEAENPKIELDIGLLLDSLEEEYCLGLKLHPFVANRFVLDETYAKKYKNRIYNFSAYKDINTLLVASQLLITDYSSVIFEYCLLGKPMIFYAYDLEKFSECGRGFYYNYEDYVPGTVVSSMKELIQVIQREEYDYEKINQFQNENYKYFDGESTKRIVNHIFRS